jgi:hypothetical protein
MRKILSLLALFISFSLAAQTGTGVTLYGYMRPSHPGIVPANHPRATLADYLIYISHPAGGSFRIMSVMVGGKPYAFSTEKDTSPVSYVNRNLPQSPRTITLVPKNKGVTEQLLLRNAPDRPGAGPLKVTYVLNGKTYSKTLSKWKELEPEMNL